MPETAGGFKGGRPKLFYIADGDSQVFRDDDDQQAFLDDD